MVSKIYNQKIQNQDQVRLINAVVRPQRKKLSYYKRRKQAGIVQEILDDPQIMGN